MSYLSEALLKKENELKEIITRLKESLRDTPEGKLRIDHCGKIPQYYYCTKETEADFKRGQYIRKENKQLAYRLAQKDYEQKLLETAEKELASVQRFQENYDAEKLANVYEQMNPCRREIVTPQIITDEMFAEQWKKVKFQGKSFAEGSAEIYTEKGERVRSKSEKIIADMLYRHGILYRYEYPITLQGLGIVYPDFTILNLKERKEVYWEHLGMMDNPEYCEKALYKLNCYVKNGIYLGNRLLISYETSKRPLETVVIEKMMKETFFVNFCTIPTSNNRLTFR